MTLVLAEKLTTFVMNFSFESLLMKLFVKNDFPVPLEPITPGRKHFCSTNMRISSEKLVEVY